MAEVSLKIKKKDGTFLELDKSYLQSIESLTQLTSDPSSIQYGALPNSGSATAVDIDGEIKKAIENGTIDNSNLQAEFWMNGNRISSHIITDSDYTPDKVFSVQMSDNISKWDAIYAGRSLTDSMTAYALLKEVLKTLPDNYSDNTIDTIILGKTLVYGEDNSTGTVADFLKTITITYPYLNSDTYRNTFAKFCNLAQLQCFQDEDGYPVFVSARPIIPQDTNTTIHVPRRAQVSELKYPILLKNKYDGISSSGMTVKDGSYIFAATVSKDATTNNSGVTVTPHWLDTDPTYFNITCNYDLNENRYWKTLDKFKVYLTISGQILDTKTGNQSLWDGTISKQTEQTTFDSTFNAEDNYSVKLGSKVLKENIIFNFSKTINNNRLTISFGIYMDSGYYQVIEQNKEYITWGINSFEMQIFPDSVKTDNEYKFKKGNNAVNFQSNELFDNISKFEKISDNIKYDYSDGIADASTTLFPINLNTKFGSLAKDFSKGQLLTNGDIVYFDKDMYTDGTQRYWRITSVKPSYSGEPLIDIGLMEVKTIISAKTWQVKEWVGRSDLLKGFAVWSSNKGLYDSEGNANQMWYSDLTGSLQWLDSNVWRDVKPDARDIWVKDGKFYLSMGTNQYVLEDDDTAYNKEKWTKITWNGFTNLTGRYIWNDGTNYYYSDGSKQYVLSDNTWVQKTWAGITSFRGDRVWDDGSNYYYSNGDSQYVLDKSTSTWVIQRWNDFSNLFGEYVWKDNNNNVYYSFGENQYLLKGQSWKPQPWNNLKTFNGTNIWKYSNNIYYSNGAEQYILT